MSADAAVFHALNQTARRFVAGGQVLLVQQGLGQALQEQVARDQRQDQTPNDHQEAANVW